MVNTSPLVEKVGTLATLVATMMATSRTGGTFGYEAPVIERKGVSSIQSKIAAGLVGLGLAACSYDITVDENGNEIPTSRGKGCDWLKGKYLWAFDCVYGMVGPVGDDCSMGDFYDELGEKAFISGVINGREWHTPAQEGYPAVVSELVRSREVEDHEVRFIEGYSNMSVESFICIFQQDPNLAAGKPKGEPFLSANDANIYSIKDEPYPFDWDLCRSKSGEQPKFDRCWDL